jgi:hypothetical protein
MREDDGSDMFALPCYGLSYATLLAGISPVIPAACKIPAAFRVDVASASDADVLHAVAGLVGAYLRGLVYAQDADHRYVGSPFDRFLILNGLPRAPEPGEAAIDYARRLRAALDALKAPKLVDPSQLGVAFTHHDEPFAFGADALAGLRVFLAEPAAATGASSDELAAGGVGNCVACHAPPHFTDFGFHATGVAQAEYDGLHGAGAFAALAIPSLAERTADPDRFLPPSPAHPTAAGPFLQAAAADRPGATDLGLWNVFANDDVPVPQALLPATVRALTGAPDSAGTAELLPLTVAMFKTPTLRDLGQSPPYFHNGADDTVDDVVRHYQAASALARAGMLRNGAPQLAGIALGDKDLAPLAAFLRALDEDYE